MEPEYFKTCAEILAEADKFNAQIQIMEDTLVGMVSELHEVANHQGKLWQRWYYTKYAITPGVTQIWHGGQRFVIIAIEPVDPHEFTEDPIRNHPEAFGMRIIRNNLIGQRAQTLRGFDLAKLEKVMAPITPANQQEFLQLMQAKERQAHAQRKS